MQKKQKKQAVRGLEGVVAAETDISYVDGKEGKLFYRGYNIDELAGNVCYEEVVYLLLFGKLPTQDELNELRASIISEMRLPAQIHDFLRTTPPSANPMVVLRTAVSALGIFDLDGGVNTEAANYRKAIRILGQTATIVASLNRMHWGEPVLSPDARKSFSENFLYMLRGDMPDEIETKAFDATLVLHADHGLAASTFAARTTVSTLAGMHSAMSAALASLKGPLHGGANVKVLEMLEDINGPEDVKPYIQGMLQTGKRVSGFGHRVYKTEDPRSVHLRQYSEDLCSRAGLDHLYELSHNVEKRVMKMKKIRPNVDFYSATVQRALHIPKEFFTCIFAVSRTAGWCAHILEQFRDNRLIRPTSLYTGGFDNKFVPIEKRKKRRKKA